MSYELDAARRYRAHAEELRTIAENDKHYESREMLLKVAMDYERMARKLEDTEQRNLSLQRH